MPKVIFRPNPAQPPFVPPTPSEQTLTFDVLDHSDYLEIRLPVSEFNLAYPDKTILSMNGVLDYHGALSPLEFEYIYDPSAPFWYAFTEFTFVVEDASLVVTIETTNGETLHPNCVLAQ